MSDIFPKIVSARQAVRILRTYYHRRVSYKRFLTLCQSHIVPAVFDGYKWMVFTIEIPVFIAFGLV